MTRLGLCYRPEVAWLLHGRRDLDFLDVVAESLPADASLPGPLARFVAEGRTVVPHGVGLSLGGAEPLEMARLDTLCRLAERLGAPFVSEHVAFVRGGGLEAGHLLPIERSERGLSVLIDNVRAAQAVLPVPLVLENVATLVRWPGDTLSEGEFLSALVEATSVRLLFDAANAHANAENHGETVDELLDALPLEAIAYVHVAGGIRRDGLYHDTHAHPVAAGALSVLHALCARVTPEAVVLERDAGFGTRAELEAELGLVAAALAPISDTEPGALMRPAASGVRAAPSPDGTRASRGDLAREQAALVAGLLDAGTLPQGFDRHHAGAAARALADKRARHGIAGDATNERRASRAQRAVSGSTPRCGRP